MKDKGDCIVYDEEKAKRIREHGKRWEQQRLRPLLSRSPERLTRFSTVSDEEISALYTPSDVEDLEFLNDVGFPGEYPLEFLNDVGFPGEYPYTRGVQPSMYRGRLWTMRQFSGFGSAEDTNARYHYLLSQGQTGLSVAFHFPTLMGYDSDHQRARGEVGMCGVAVDSLKDMEILFHKIPLDRITTSMTINAPAAILLAMYIAVAEQQGVSAKRIGGTIQNDILLLDLSPRSFHADHHRHPGLLLGPRAEVEHHQHQRLPHPGGGLDGGAGTRVHHRRRHRLRPGRDGGGHPGGQVRPAPLLFLQRPHGLLRGDRQVPGRAADVGAHHEGTVQGAGRELLEAALPHPDRRGDAHRPAADQQCGAGGPPGVDGGPRGNPVPPYEFHGRIARPSHRAGRDHRPADAADPRRRIRRGELHRPARRFLPPRETDERRTPSTRSAVPSSSRN